MRLNRIMIAAPKSGSGKTSVTCALLQALKERGLSPVAYKCGPDYIDPMFHKTVLNIPSKNLDTFFTGEAGTRALFLDGRKNDDFAVIEGVMGLFDGLGGIREEGSSYHLAKVTRTPIILVVDAKGMGKSVLPLIAGFLSYDTEHLICGVILNRMSAGYFEVLKPILEQELTIPVLGYLPEHKSMKLESRHLGLLMPQEIKEIREQLKESAWVFQKTVSVGKILALAKAAEPIAEASWNQEIFLHKKTLRNKRTSQSEKISCDEKITVEKDCENVRPVIAVARDEAFCFYYEDNLRLLEAFGAKLSYFSPIHDNALPENCNAILLGGGYPELYGAELSKNQAMLDAVRNAVQGGMPIVAECGGFLYLHSAIIMQDGTRYQMAGVLSGVCTNMGKLVRFGYHKLSEKEAHFLPAGEEICAHEFHYFDSTENGESCIARKPVTGKTYPCILSGKTYWLGFPHLYYPSNPEFAKRFAELAREYASNFVK